MRVNRVHRLIGIVLLLPMLAWTVTGFIFLIKPGYGGAYETLAVKTYPIGVATSVTPQPSWLEFRALRSVLGEHLLVRTAAGWRQLDPRTSQPRSAPDDADLRRLVADAISDNSQRYGAIVSTGDGVVRTDTGAEIKLDWQQMRLQQYGRDTGWIDTLYRIHYLQWTGVPAVDQVLGAAGLALLLGLTALGATLAFRRNSK
jgi:hypothetical protein